MEQQTDPFAGLGESLKKGWARGRAIAAVLQTLDQVLVQLLSLVTLPAELVLHHRFGERHFSLLKVLIAAAIPVGPIGAAGVQAPAFYQIAIVMPWVVIGGSLVHWIFAVRRRKVGGRWHSRCDGLPNLLNAEHSSHRAMMITFQYVEPGILIVAGLAIAFVSQPIGLYIHMLGIALALKVALQKNADTNKLLDAIDSQIESENLSGALDAESPVDTDGFYVHSANSFTPQQKLSVARAYGGLSPELSDLITVRPTAVAGADAPETPSNGTPEPETAAER